LFYSPNTDFQAKPYLHLETFFSGSAPYLYTKDLVACCLSTHSFASTHRGGVGLGGMGPMTWGWVDWDDWGCGWGQDVWGGAGVGPRTYVQGMGG